MAGRPYTGQREEGVDHRRRHGLVHTTVSPTADQLRREPAAPRVIFAHNRPAAHAPPAAGGLMRDFRAQLTSRARRTRGWRPYAVIAHKLTGRARRTRRWRPYARLSRTADQPLRAPLAVSSSAVQASAVQASAVRLPPSRLPPLSQHPPNSVTQLRSTLDPTTALLHGVRASPPPASTSERPPDVRVSDAEGGT